MTIETKKLIKNQIKIVNDNQNCIHDVVVETNVDVLPLGAILACAIVPNSPIKTKWSNDN